MEPGTSRVGYTQEDVYGPNVAVVILHLDTTGFSSNKSICQISAACNGNRFQVYILPEQNFESKASIHNDFSVGCTLGKKILFHKGIQVDALDAKKGFEMFMDFLKKQSQHVILVGQKCNTFIVPTLKRKIQELEMVDEFQNRVLGVTDTISVFKILLERKKGLGLKELEKEYLGDNVPRDNLDILLELISKLGCTDILMRTHAKPL